MATMQEIAELAGVSRGTVDRVLNHRGGVNDATQDKILEIARLLNYEPNKAGIALASQKKDFKIGVLLFGDVNQFSEAVVDGINNRQADFAVYGCECIIRRARFNINEQLKALDELAGENLSGLIISPYQDERIKKRINDLTDAGIPVVTLITDLPDSKRIAYVGSDSYKSGRTAGGLMGLLTHGQAEVGILNGSNGVKSHDDRIRGFRDVINKSYPGIQIEVIDECGNDDYKAYETVQGMLREYPTINAFFFTAGGVYGGCKAIYQLTAKKDFTVITFDEHEYIIDYIKKGVITATICQAPYIQGYRSYSILAEKLLFDKDPDEVYSLTDLTIKIKESL